MMILTIIISLDGEDKEKRFKATLIGVDPNGLNSLQESAANFLIENINATLREDFMFNVTVCASIENLADAAKKIEFLDSIEKKHNIV